MSTAQHTPGPWVPCYTMLGKTVLSWHVAGNKHGSSLPICVSDKFSDSRDQNQEVANASLISASPEMLDALKSLVKWYANRTVGDQLAAIQPPEIQVAINIIVKVTGEAP